MTQASSNNRITTPVRQQPISGEGTAINDQHQEAISRIEVEGTEERPVTRGCSQGVGDFFRSWKTGIRPWSEFLRVSNFSCPPCTNGWVTRIKKNLTYFLANYFAITVVLALCSIITSFWLLISTIILGILIYIIRRATAKGPIIIGEEEIPSWILYAIAVFVTIPLFIFAHVGYIIYCAIGVSAIIIFVHALFYGNEPEIIDNDKRVRQIITEPPSHTATTITISSDERPMIIPERNIRFIQETD